MCSLDADKVLNAYESQCKMHFGALAVSLEASELCKEISMQINLPVYGDSTALWSSMLISH